MITEFSPEYNLRAFRRGREEGIAIGVAHSHPSGYLTRPSQLDDDMDTYFAQELTHFTGGMPYCSIILQWNERHGFTFSGRVYDRGQWLPVKTMLTVGNRLDRDTSELCRTSVPELESFGEESTTARRDALFGDQSAQRLREATVGIIGNSGTGTPVGNTLARAGVGGFVVVDPQRISPSNHERTHTTVHRDLSHDPLPFKAELMKRMIHSINPNAKVVTMVGNALQANVIDELLRCDVVLGCTDTIHGRVLLSDLAKHHLLPSIDTGVDMAGKDGKLTSQLVQFTRYGADDPCAFCYGVVDASDMATELMTSDEREMRQSEAAEAMRRGDSPDPYWRTERQIHTVGYLTGTAGAMASGYAEGWLTGAFAMPHASFQMDIGQPHLGVIPLRVNDPDCDCRAKLGWGDLAAACRNVAKPNHWRNRAVLLA
ncbi:UBA/THIF-type NAD/FAD binding protein [Rhodopirellula baltica WH47]|uniref:UBA/THIF-type NAD/FAD binding protein n=1 Tax=Rhodopirellula baltica WH47 TaxID=991778 RepID=F2ART0_RHOBT|nr:UBA/THIF-type NAD/FAD binding protein [Rhodopirellula baltica WH47]